MKHVKTLNSANLKQTAAKGGCGECQASCQGGIGLFSFLPILMETTTSWGLKART